MSSLVFRGATVYPGDAPPHGLDVRIAGGAIDAVGENLEGEVVDARGLLLCPGFVDLHAHSALASWDDPLLAPKLLQGITTEVINPDGLAPAPVTRAGLAERRAYLRALEGEGPSAWGWETFAEYLDALEATRPAISLVPSIGHGAARDVVLGSGRVTPTEEDLKAIQAEIRRGLEAGARTVSFGLVYIPGAYADTGELFAVAEEAARFGAPLVPHVRNEGSGVLDAVAEFVDVARRSGASLHLSHLKSLAGDEYVEPLLDLIERASADVDVTFDQYPYGAGATLLASVLPGWAQAGGPAETLARLRDREQRARIARDVANGLPGWENQLGTLGPERIVVDGLAIADRSGDTVDVVAELLLESGLAASMVLHYATDDAVRTIARHRLQLVGSDGIFGALPHPRLYGTMPRFVGRFCLREQLVPLEEAVARVTARAAARIGLTDRGRIAPGLRADLVLLDPERYVDTATYEDPKRSPDGVAGAWVRGERAVKDGAPTGVRAGGVVR